MANAFSDLLKVGENTPEDIERMIDPEKYFTVIMKNGVIYKNTL